MDESFAVFLKGFGPPIAKREVDEAKLAQYAGELPALLRGYWKEHGFTGYADGLFWTVDPADYTLILETAVEGTPLAAQDTYHVIARTAFGQLFAWGKRTGVSLRVDIPHGLLFPSGTTLEQLGGEDIAVESFFLSQQQRLLDFADDAKKPLFARARKKLGRLAADEMYGFEPALALGGPATFANLQKVKILPHLQILLALGPLRVLENPFGKR
jgi:hypothetical protein